MTEVIDYTEKQISEAIAHYWQTRKAQREKQKEKGVSDAGLRSAVTGGAQIFNFPHRGVYMKHEPIQTFQRLIKETQEICRSWTMNPYISSSPHPLIGISNSIMKILIN
jgi:hypothetical protein